MSGKFEQKDTYFPLTGRRTCAPTWHAGLAEEILQGIITVIKSVADKSAMCVQSSKRVLLS
jgi:hypothetical protein